MDGAYPYKTDISKLALVKLLFPKETSKSLHKRLEKASTRYCIHPLITVAPRRAGLFKQDVLKLNMCKIPAMYKTEDYGITWINLDAFEMLLDLYL
jgi:hypothetical protein